MSNPVSDLVAGFQDLVAQVPDLSGGLWLIVERPASAQAHEAAGPR